MDVSAHSRHDTPNPPIRLLDLPHAEARALAASGAPVYLTVNPVEYHGPHLSLHNDRLISEGLCRELHARLSRREGSSLGAPLLDGGELEVGVEPCPGMGTRHTRYSTTRELVLESCRALAELGARRVIIMSFHGAPLHNLAIDAGVRWLNARGIKALSPFNLVLRQMILMDDSAPYADALQHIADPTDRAAMARGLQHDFHAGFFETSVALHYAPSSVSERHRRLPPSPAITPNPGFVAASKMARSLGRELLSRELDFAAVALGWGALRPFPGYTARPDLASAESGACFARHLIDLYTPATESVLDGDGVPPEPIMAWTDRLSAGGRFGASPRPQMSEMLFGDP